MLSSTNRLNLKKLVDALRSGEYKQNTGCLKQGNTYCCLGVACDLFIKENSEYGWQTKGDWNEYEINDKKAYLPLYVANWLGIDNPFITLLGDNLHSAAYLNDILKYDFNQIADLIEREYLSNND